MIKSAGSFINRWLNSFVGGNLPLDSLGNVYFAFSTRKLSKDYAGSSFELNNGTTAIDVGFDSNGNLDVAAAETHLGGLVGYITKWYDQSGNGNDFVMATTANSPVYLGVVNMKYPSLKFNGVDRWLDDNGISAGSASDFVIAAVMHQQSVAARQAIYSSGNPGIDAWAVADVTTRRGYSTPTDGNIYADAAINPFVGPTAIAYKLVSSASGQVWINTSTMDTGLTYTQTAPTAVQRIGRQAGSGNYLDAELSELIILNDSITDNQLDTLQIGQVNYFFDTSNLLALGAGWTVDGNGAFKTDPYPLLDTYGANIDGAWSLRKVRTAYSGDCIRVRRSSDSTELDIGFNGDDLDTASLLSFVGAGNGFVVTWYDQSANGRNATQATATKQPQIVSSGSVLTENGKPKIQFDNNDDVLATAGFLNVGPTTTNHTIFVTWKPDAISGSFDARVVGIGSTNQFLRTRTTGGRLEDIGDDDIIPGAATLAQQLYIGQVEAGASFGDDTNWLNDDVATGGQHNVSLTNASVQLGGLSGFTRTINGSLQEVILYSDAKGDDRYPIKTNINAYWGTY